LQGVQLSEIKTAQVHTLGGLQGVQLYPASVILELAFEFDIALAKLMGEAGAKVYLYGLAGYRVSIAEPIPQLTPSNLPTDEIGWIEYALATKKALVASQAQIEATAPATALGQLIESAVNEIRIGDYAKSIGMGQNKYFEELRSDGVICLTSTLPYQRWIDSGYFRVTQIQQQTSRGLQTYPVALIKPKGQAWLAKRHQKYLVKESAIVTIEAQVSALV
jgi:phage antirepressor YoqD-like protein